MNNMYNQDQNQRFGMMRQAMQRRPAGPMAPGGMGMRRNPIQGAAQRMQRPGGGMGRNQSQQTQFQASRAAAMQRRPPMQAPAGGVDMMGGTAQPQAAYGQGYSIGPGPQPRPAPQMNMQLDPMTLQRLQMDALGGMY